MKIDFNFQPESLKKAVNLSSKNGDHGEHSEMIGKKGMGFYSAK